MTQLEVDTGFKVRVLTQQFPKTPGPVLRRWWNLDNNTVTVVADPTQGNLLHIDVGLEVEKLYPRVRSRGYKGGAG